MKLIKALALTMCIGLLTGCSQNNNDKYYKDIMQEKDEVTQEVRQTKKKEGNLEMLIFSFGDSEIYSAFAQQYMEKNPEVTISIEVIEMVDALSWNKSMEVFKSRLYTEMLGDHVPDIIEVSIMPPIRVAESGWFVNLYPYIESKSFNQSDYYMNVFDAMSYEDKLYMLPFAFTYDIYSFNNQWIDIADFESKEGIYYKDLVTYYKYWHEKEKKDYVQMYSRSAPIMLVNKELDYFINYKEKQAKLDSQEFVEVLELSKSITQNKEFTMMTPEGFGVLSGGEGLFFKKEKKLSDYLFLEQEASAYCLSALIPYEGRFWENPLPEVDNEGRYIFRTLKQFAIPQASANQDLAWDFLNYCISPEALKALEAAYDDRGMAVGKYNNGQIPINKTNFHKVFRDYIERTLTLNSAVCDGLDKEMITERAIEQIDRWNSKQEQYMSEYHEVQTLVYPELYAFYTGKLDSIQTSQRMQIRVEQYLNE